jgi:chemotaxis protein histidine kinase CheA
MKVDLKRFHDTFFEEAFEHLATMETGLLELETRGAEAELLNTIFRAAHSIKGGSGSFGFTEIARLTHALENVLDRLRGGRRRERCCCDEQKCDAYKSQSVILRCPPEAGLEGCTAVAHQSRVYPRLDSKCESRQQPTFGGSP